MPSNSRPPKAASDTAKAAPESTQSFEQQLEALEAIVQRMESGDLPLEESLREFERGQKLARACQQTLEAAQQRVRVLLGEDAAGAAEEGAGDADADDDRDRGAPQDDGLPF